MKRYHTARVVVHLKYTKESFQKFFLEIIILKCQKRNNAAQQHNVSSIYNFVALN